MIIMTLKIIAVVFLVIAALVVLCVVGAGVIASGIVAMLIFAWGSYVIVETAWLGLSGMRYVLRKILGLGKKEKQPTLATTS